MILARNVVFEGRDAIIKGWSFSIALYPIDQTGLLGSTLEQALQRSEPRFINAKFSSAAARNIAINLPVIKDGSLTIDVSGFGYKQWLEQRAAVKGRNGRIINAVFLPQHVESENGPAGVPGKNIFKAADGAPITAAGPTGAAGTCGSTSTVNGKNGGNGQSGNNGAMATENGGNGGDGGPGGVLISSVPDKPVSSYIFTASGGDGAPGGKGGDGGWGSKEEKGEQAGRVLTVLAIKVAQESVGQADRVGREARALVEPTGVREAVAVTGAAFGSVIRCGMERVPFKHSKMEASAMEVDREGSPVSRGALETAEILVCPVARLTVLMQAGTGILVRGARSRALTEIPDKLV